MPRGRVSLFSDGRSLETFLCGSLYELWSKELRKSNGQRDEWTVMNKRRCWKVDVGWKLNKHLTSWSEMLHLRFIKSREAFIPSHEEWWKESCCCSWGHACTRYRATLWKSMSKISLSMHIKDQLQSHIKNRANTSLPAMYLTDSTCIKSKKRRRAVTRRWTAT